MSGHSILTCNCCLLLGGAGPLVVCSDCYDNANIYSRTREYCPYAYITEDDPLDQTLSSLMVQMPKESYPACAQHEGTTLDGFSPGRDMSVFLTNHNRLHERKPYNSGKCHIAVFISQYFKVIQFSSEQEVMLYFRTGNSC